MRRIAKDNDAQWKSTTPAEKHSKRGPSSHRIVEPSFVEPMQCKAVTELPEGDDWTFEIKFDGYRCLAMKHSENVSLFSRNKKKLNERFPEIVEGIAKLPGDFLIDGEIVALDEKGRPAFQLLQNSASVEVPTFFYAFDLLNRAGEDLLNVPIENRREALNHLLGAPDEPLRLSPLLQAPASEILGAVKKLGLEGVVGKRQGSIYEPGKRSGAWIKHRTDREQEFVIGGFVPGAQGFDSLIVGVFEGKQFNYVAKVKDGFVPRNRAEILPLLKKHLIAECPFANLPETKGSRWGQPLTAEKMKECRWMKPTLVCQVRFVEWTDGGKLRHCAFVGMRTDKKARTVVREG